MCQLQECTNQPQEAKEDLTADDSHVECDGDTDRATELQYSKAFSLCFAMIFSCGRVLDKAICKIGKKVKMFIKCLIF